MTSLTTATVINNITATVIIHKPSRAVARTWKVVAKVSMYCQESFGQVKALGCDMVYIY